MLKAIGLHMYRNVSRLVPPLIDETIQMTFYLGYIPNIRNPRTFNEKVAYRKHLTCDPRFARLADKLDVRGFVERTVGAKYLTKLYGYVDDVVELDLGTLPQAFVAKGRHNSGSVILVDDKSQENKEVLRKRFESAIRRVVNPGRYEYWYRDIPAGLMVEERLRDNRYFVPLDFKFLVFDGRVQFIQVFHDRMGRTALRFYDPDWRPLPVSRPRSPLAPIIERPRRLMEMIEVAEALGKGFDFVRVDLYAPNDERVVFGEMTFAPASGRKAFVPRRFDWELGSYWRINGPEEAATQEA